MISTIAIEARIRKVLRKYGFELYKTASVKRGVQYDLNIPHANYAPWNLDAEFLDVFGKIRQDSFVDKFRCYELWRIVRQSARLHGSLIEVGVWKGGTASVIAMAAKLSGQDCPIYLCENFRGVVKPTAADTHYRGGEHADSSKAKIGHYLGEVFAIRGFRILDGIFPDETGAALTNEQFKFAHIDVDTHKSAGDAFDFIWPRLVAGGCVVFDDYGFSRCDGVAKLVDAMFGLPDRLIVHNLNGHAIVIKLPA